MASRFVASQRAKETRTTSPTPGQPGQNGQNGRSGRSGAESLKMKTGKKSANSAAPPAHPALPSTAPSPGYVSNQFGERNTIPSQQYQQAEYQDGDGQYQMDASFQRDVLDDTTVGSDFDVTRSTINPGSYANDNETQDGDSADEDRSYRHPDQQGFAGYLSTKGVLIHPLHHKQNQSPLVDLKAEPMSSKPHAITGRFDDQRDKRQIEDLQFRNGHGGAFVANHDQSSKKRSHSGDAIRGSTAGGSGRPLPDEDDYEDLEIPDEIPAGRPDGITLSYANQISSDETERASPALSPNRQRKARTIPHSSSQSQNPQDLHQPVEPHDDRLFPDYKDHVLKTMKYEDLEKESMEMDPNAVRFVYPEELQGPDVTLEQRLTHYVRKPDEEQITFYENLPNDDWEKAGDWFIERFGDFMKDIRDKRRAKREAAAKFEDEIKKRERAVRGQHDKLDGEFKDMAVTGQALLRDKTV